MRGLALHSQSLCHLGQTDLTFSLGLQSDHGIAQGIEIVLPLAGFKQAFVAACAFKTKAELAARGFD